MFNKIRVVATALAVCAAVAAVVVVILQGRGDPVATASDDIRQDDTAVAPAQPAAPAVEPAASTFPGRILLLAAADAPPGALLRLPDPAIALQVDRANDAAEARALVSDATTVVIIDASAKQAADWLWVQQMFTEGRVIVGFNINMGELLTRLPAATDVFVHPGEGGFTRSDARYRPGQRFFSMVVSSAESHCSAASYDLVADKADDPANDVYFFDSLKSMRSCASLRLTPLEVETPAQNTSRISASTRAS